MRSELTDRNVSSEGPGKTLSTAIEYGQCEQVADLVLQTLESLGDLLESLLCTLQEHFNQPLCNSTAVLNNFVTTWVSSSPSHSTVS
eukprot:5979383-Amphidinium_carterae.1